MIITSTDASYGCKSKNPGMVVEMIDEVAYSCTEGGKEGPRQSQAPGGLDKAPPTCEKQRSSDIKLRSETKIVVELSNNTGTCMMLKVL